MVVLDVIRVIIFAPVFIVLLVAGAILFFFAVLAAALAGAGVINSMPRLVVRDGKS